MKSCIITEHNFLVERNKQNVKGNVAVFFTMHITVKTYWQWISNHTSFNL